MPAPTDGAVTRWIETAVEHHEARLALWRLTVIRPHETVEPAGSTPTHPQPAGDGDGRGEHPPQAGHAAGAGYRQRAALADPAQPPVAALHDAAGRGVGGASTKELARPLQPPTATDTGGCTADHLGRVKGIVARAASGCSRRRISRTPRPRYHARGMDAASRGGLLVGCDRGGRSGRPPPPTPRGRCASWGGAPGQQRSAQRRGDGARPPGARPTPAAWASPPECSTAKPR